jgi:hypothetical protein
MKQFNNLQLFCQYFRCWHIPCYYLETSAARMTNEEKWLSPADLPAVRSVRPEVPDSHPILALGAWVAAVKPRSLRPTPEH